MRKVEVNTTAGSQITGETWTPKHFTELKEGDIFRLFEEDGTPVRDSKGRSVWLASSAPYFDDRGVLTVDTHVYNKS